MNARSLMLAVAAGLMLANAPSAAQHAMHPTNAEMPVLPTSAGQAAYGTIAEVVRILLADPNTDWTKVNVEALRQHLVDMDEVIMRSVVSQRNVDGGIAMQITGTGRTVDAIRRMTKSHASVLDGGPDYRASVRDADRGVVMVVTARDPADASAVARIRGLGFAGLMTVGDHHAAHHLALARGDAAHGH